jgi:NAD+ diphosphatase
MLGFHAEYSAGEIVMQAEEIEDARWFALHDLPLLPSANSISRYLIELYLARRSGGREPVLPS